MKTTVPVSPFTFIGTGSEWFWAALQFLVITITLLLIHRQLRIQSFSHVVSVISKIDDQWNSHLMLVARLRTCEKWMKVYCDQNENPDALRELNTDLDGNALAIADFFEDLAVYNSKRIIPSDMIWHTYSWYLEYYWTIFKEGILQMQNRLKDPTLYSLLPELIAEMEKENRRRKAPNFAKTKEEIMSFFTMEINSLKDLIESEREK